MADANLTQVTQVQVVAGTDLLYVVVNGVSDAAISVDDLAAIIGGGTSDHGELDGLADDDHTQYAKLTGRAGSQTLQGGTAANEDLTLEGTAHATKTTSYVLIQPTGGKTGVGSGSNAPQATLHIGGGSDAPGFGNDADRCLYVTNNGQTDLFFRDSAADAVGRFTAGPSGSVQMGTASNHEFQILSNNTGRIWVHASGMVSMNVSSDTNPLYVGATAAKETMVVVGAAGQNTFRVTASGSAGNSYGPIFHCGTNSSDRAFLIRDASGGSDYFTVRGDGQVKTHGEIEIDGSLNHDGTTVGFYGVAPTTQAATIADADGSLGDVTSKFNTLLAKLEALGLLASA